ncbi:formate dehydrogenase accessory sulfurtransferase FdhD [Mumia sp. ZJ430]|uniref:formate dehydrogenase accessory sulfurtransferase FdhD n=1 Tax=Mumia sp. ZJ430 TaxID=2708083 RepID=UPI0014233CE2|nr:formate dehydrogenase accessory sulfurtransferase FdhD [Mumia sp. ZJ430]
MTAPTGRRRVVEWVDGVARAHDDRLIAEEPLEIRVAAPGARDRRLGVTMRTPGHDFALAAGLVLSEGVVAGRDEIAGIAYCTDARLAEEQRFNVVTVALAAGPARDWQERSLRATSACGVCGTDSLDEVADLVARLPVRPASRWDPSALAVLPDLLRRHQQHFDRTGGAHAAGLFRPDGSVVVVREDVGRHNAVDKVVGHALLEGGLLGGDAALNLALCTSGRIGFEVVQKAAVAGFTAVVGVGAPTTLAARLCDQAGLTLAGFARDGRVVVYADGDPSTT